MFTTPACANESDYSLHSPTCRFRLLSLPSKHLPLQLHFPTSLLTHLHNFIVTLMPLLTPNLSQHISYQICTNLRIESGDSKGPVPPFDSLVVTLMISTCNLLVTPIF